MAGHDMSSSMRISEDIVMQDRIYPPRTYAQLYHPPEEHRGDTPKVRRRLSAVFKEAVSICSSEIARRLEKDLGVELANVNSVTFRWSDYLMRLEWMDFLSVFSVVHDYYKEKSETVDRIDLRRDYVDSLSVFISDVRRVFGEESVLLTLGDDGIIHPKVDPAFDRQRTTVIRGLQGDEYENARDHLDNLERAMLRDPADGAEAIRRVFLMAENVFKQSYPEQSRLAGWAVKKFIGPKLDQIYEQGSNKHELAKKQLEGFAQWVDGAHYYRHEEGRPAPSQPPEELYILAVSEGFAFVRWLVDLRGKSTE